MLARAIDYSVDCPRTRREFNYETLLMLLSNPPNLPAAEMEKPILQSKVSPISLDAWQMAEPSLLREGS